jgi:hypothetical protein
MLFIYAGVQQPTPFKTGEIYRYTTQHLALIESLRNWTCCQFWIYLSCWPIPPANFCSACRLPAFSPLSITFAAHKWTVSRDFKSVEIYYKMSIILIFTSHWVGFCLNYSPHPHLFVCFLVVDCDLPLFMKSYPVCNSNF